MTMTDTARITRDDLETKLREVTGDFEDKVDAARPQLLGGAAAGIILALLVAYLLGRRRGRKRSAVVEIRRV
jgi:hypothetical protein